MTIYKLNTFIKLLLIVVFVGSSCTSKSKQRLKEINQNDTEISTSIKPASIVYYSNAKDSQPANNIKILTWNIQKLGRTKEEKSLVS